MYFNMNEQPIPERNFTYEYSVCSLLVLMVILVSLYSPQAFEARGAVLLTCSGPLQEISSPQKTPPQKASQPNLS